MNRTVAYGALLVALGLVGGVALGRRSDRDPIEASDRNLAGSAFRSDQRPRSDATDAGGAGNLTLLERRLDVLASKLTSEANERHRLEARLEGLASELASVRASSGETGQALLSKPEPAAATEVATSSSATTSGANQAPTTMESALVAAGIDASTAAEIKRHRDELALSEIYLRDLAAREGWQDTPRFAEEMAEIERQRTSMRDEIGDTAYDRYLAALDHPNRVAVDDVLADSPAAVAGLQAGDLVLRYGDTRIFAPEELVAATRGGTSGETVRVAIIRQGQQFEVEVPRGPLGIRIAASRGTPTGG